MASILLQLLVALCAATRSAGVEIGRAESGHFMCLTNAATEGGWFRLSILDGDQLLFHHDWTHDHFIQFGERRYREVPDTRRLGGPIPWGVTGDAMYYVMHFRSADELSSLRGPEKLTSTRIGGHVEATEFMLWQARRELTPERVDRGRAFQFAHTSHCLPLMEWVSEDRYTLHSNWNLTFDYLYTSLEDVVVVAVRQGKMYRWDLDNTGDGNHPWTTTDPFDTPIEGIFRILRAGKDLANLYIIDELGDIYVGFGPEHRKVGTVRDYHNLDRTVLTLLFEDQQTQKIGILHATEDGTITVPEITWEEEGHAVDFMTELDTDETRASIARLAEVLRQDANDARGE